MADAVRLDNMIASVRTRSGMETLDQANAFATDAEIIKLLNYFLRRVYTRLIRARSANYYRAATTLAISNGVSAYSLAAPFFELISVSLLITANEQVPIYPYTESERHMYDISPGWMRGQTTAYQLQGNNINFIPVPAGTYSVQVNYVPAFVALVAAADTFDGVAGFEDAAVWEVVGALKDKDEADPTYALMQAKFMYEEIAALADMRDNTAAPRVQMIRKSRKYGGWNI